jgi:hypothetical protein
MPHAQLADSSPMQTWLDSLGQLLFSRLVVLEAWRASDYHEVRRASRDTARRLDGPTPAYLGIALNAAEASLRVEGNHLLANI